MLLQECLQLLELRIELVAVLLLQRRQIHRLQQILPLLDDLLLNAHVHLVLVHH